MPNMYACMYDLFSLFEWYWILCIVCPSCANQTLDSILDMGTVSNCAHPDVWRDDHTINSRVGFPSEHDGGDIWRGEKAFIYSCYALLMDNFGVYDMLCLFGGYFPIGQLDGLSIMPFVRYFVGVYLI